MVDKLRAIKLFVRLADLGSFTKVAEEHGSSKSMISKEISRLEAALSARLLQRSTRNIQMTDVGTWYLQRCREILAQLDDMEAYVHEVQGKVRGRLKINIPMALGITDLSKAFAEYMQTYPEIELELHLGDESVDLIEQGFDLGLRASSRPFESSYVGRALTRFNYRVCAAPEYLRRHPLIKAAADLEAHNCFVYSYFRGKNIWPLEHGIGVSGNLKVNNTIFMKEAVLKGLGIGFLPSFVCRDEIADGRLVEVLAPVKRPQLTLYALYPTRHFVPPKLTQCIEFLYQWFNSGGGCSDEAAKPAAVSGQTTY